MKKRRRTPAEFVRTWGRFFQILWVVLAEWLGGRIKGRSQPDVVHRAVVRLGPTFIKLGQIASTRPDLVPRDVSERLESLQERVPEYSFAQARRRIEEELDMPLEQAFGTFPDQPIAAASLSQVYLADLPDGTPVAVKVRRPGIRPVIERDLAILHTLAAIAAAFVPSFRKLKMARAVDEFGRWTLKELDFRIEGQNFDEFRRNFADWPDVTFPTVYWTHTTPAVLTMERVAGMRLHEVPEKVGKLAARKLAHRLAELEMKMFISDQFFHADLHPGNIFFRPDGSIAVIDVGMVGRMSLEQRDRFLAYWIAVSRQQRERAFHHLLKMAESTAGADLSGFHTAYNDILDQFYGRMLSERSLARTYLEIVVTGSRYGVVFPSALILQAKAVVTAEALTLVLAPDWEFAEEVRPIVARELAKRATPEKMLDRLWGNLTEWIVLGEAAPPGAPPDPSLDEEDSFRRHAVSALAEVWAREADESLRDVHEKMDDYTSAQWWRERPELWTLLVQALGLLRQLDRGVQRARDENTRGLKEPNYWDDAYIERASATTTLASLRHLVSQAARAAREAAEPQSQ